jgi:C4-dicarboxylate transporter DctM subunit
MDPFVLLILIIGLLLALAFIGVPIAFAMAITGSLGIFFMGGMPTVFYTLSTFPVSRCATFGLAVIPLYILLGNLACAAGIASDAYKLADRWLGNLKGGLAMVTIGACALMGATTGSTVAEAATMGKIAIPEMLKYRYDKRLAVGSVASAGGLAILIPPSISFVIYAIVTYQSIGKLFIAGILPGILTTLLYLGMIYIRCFMDPYLAPSSGIRILWKERMLSLVNSWGILVIFGVVMGGLYTGIASATEVGALGCFVAFIITLVAIARGKSDWDALKESIFDAARLCSMIFAFVVGGGLLSLFIAMTGVVPLLVDFTVGLQVPRVAILICIIIFYLPLGMFLDPMAMILVTVPVFYPILVDGLGYDPIWFGVILVILIEISVITPPMAINLYIIKGVSPKEITMSDIFQGSLWFMTMELAVIGILIIFPEIATWLPSKMR